MRAALTMDVLATDLADYLVRKGVRSFRARMIVAALTLIHTGTLPRDTSRVGARSGARRSTPMPA